MSFRVWFGFKSISILLSFVKPFSDEATVMPMAASKICKKNLLISFPGRTCSSREYWALNQTTDYFLASEAKPSNAARNPPQESLQRTFRLIVLVAIKDPLNLLASA